jgi:acyl-CoA synthetase (NDP forming)
MDSLSAAIVASSPAGGVLTEAEAYAAAQVLGLAVPRHVAADRPPSPGDLPPGDRLVVKVLSRSVTHKARAGGVAVVPRDEARAVAGAMLERFGDSAQGCMIAEHVAHDTAAELLVGVTRTTAFGTVVTIGPGGSHAEDLAAALGILVVRAGHPPPTNEDVAALPFTALGPDPVDVARLAATVAARAPLLPGALTSFEANPVVVTEHGTIALDALATVGESTSAAPPRPGSGIDAMLRPSSIGIVGVSGRGGPGREILRNVLGAGFPTSAITVVKPGEAEIDGVRCVPAVTALPESVDLLVLAVAAADVPGLLEEIVAGDLAASVVVVAAGLGERPGSEHLAAEVASLLAGAREHGGGPVVVGANSMGVSSVPGGYDATFIPPDRLAGPSHGPAGPVAIASQSGAFAITRMERHPALRPRYVVTLGNQIDVTLGDVLTAFARDPDVAVAACYVEGIQPGDGGVVLDAVDALAGRGALALVRHGGTTPGGAAAAASHTAAIATDAVVTRSLLEAHGALVAATLDEYDDLLAIAAAWHDRELGAGRLGVISNAGFEVVAAADGAQALPMPAPAPETIERLAVVLEDAGLGSIVEVRNPLDVTPMADDTTFAGAVEAMLDDPGVDVALVGCVPLTPTLRADAEGPGWVGERLASLARHPTPWAAVVDAGSRYDTLAETLVAAGVVVFRTVDRAASAIAGYVSWRSDVLQGRHVGA